MTANLPVLPPAATTFPLPAGLSRGLSDNQDIQEVLDCAPTLHAAATRCFLAAKAPGTIRSYDLAIRRFQSYCEQSSLPFPAFTSDMVTKYILHLDTVHAPFSFYKTLKPAITYFEAAQGSVTAFNPTIDLLIAGAEHPAGATAGPVKKAAILPVSSIHAMLSAVFLPHVDTIQELCPILFRTLFRVVFIYHTLCRLDCFRKLRAPHFELVGNDILVTFPSAKNDQLHRGRQSCLAASASPYCPVRLTKLYFHRFGLHFGALTADPSFLNFQLRRDRARTLPIFHRSLSASTATADLRRLLARVGAPHQSLTDKSVTAAFESGASTEDVMHAGHWQTPAIALRYKVNSTAFKRNMASKIPSLLPT